ncbi:MAG: CCA tRNA nucleotidyltransferase [Candidatus Handelsmanbacteria bacterium]|nr:CCA tRNA nucleotidyltransferase [Candidatus Handelsmanbacteria bacterium]
MEIETGALAVVRALREAGFQALFAGGCVRDLLLGKPTKDWDIATDAAPNAVMRLFPGSAAVGAHFGVVLVRVGKHQYEVARFRRDGVYKDGRRPEAVEFAGAEEDAGRRDFTVNGIFLDPQSGQVIDYVGGREDLEKRLIRAIGEPGARFEEDHLRLLRAVRFAARLDFAIEAGTLAAVAELAPLILRVSAERVRDELTLMLTEGRAGRAMQFLLETGLMAQLLPEVAAMDGVAQPPEFHPEGDVWTHVRLMLDQMAAPTPTLAWGVLLHDIGKPPTYREADRIRFDAHDEVGAQMAEGICRRLRLSGEQSERIDRLVGQHMRIRHAKEMRPSKLKRLLREPYFSELLELHRIDCVASHGMLDIYEFCQAQLQQGESEALRPPHLLTGDDLIALGFEPGPRFKEVLAALEDEQLEGRVQSRVEAERFVRDKYHPHPLEDRGGR